MKKIAVFCLSLVLAAPVVLAQSTTKQSSFNAKPGKIQKVTRLEPAKEIRQFGKAQQKKIIKTHIASHGEQIMVLTKGQKPGNTTVTTDSISGNLERAVYQSRTKGDIYHNNVTAETTKPSRPAAPEEADEEVVFLTEDDVYHKDVTRGRHLIVNKNIDLEALQEPVQSPDDFHRNVSSQSIVTPSVTDPAKQGAAKSKSRFARSSDAAYQAVSIAEMLQNANIEVTEEEMLATQKTLRELVQLNYTVSFQKKEEPLVILQSFVYFYEEFAKSFAANNDVSSRFEAKNPQLVKWLAQYMQKPLKAGWEKDKTIVMGSYIAEHLPEAYASWSSSELADELDTFNRDILIGATK